MQNLSPHITYNKVGSDSVHLWRIAELRTLQGPEHRTLLTSPGMAEKF